MGKERLLQIGKCENVNTEHSELAAFIQDRIVETNELTRYPFPHEYKEYEEYPCTDWNGKTNTNGYPILSKKGYEYYLVHRIQWILHKNEGKMISPDIVIRHLCNNKRCLNPMHLVSGTQRDNVQDAVFHGLTKIGRPSDKINKEDALQIRELYQTGLFTHQDLAAIYHVSRRNITKIINGATFKHVGGITFKTERTQSYHPKTILNKQKAEEIRELYNQGKTQSSIANIFNVKLSTIQDVINMRTFK